MHTHLLYEDLCFETDPNELMHEMANYSGRHVSAESDVAQHMSDWSSMLSSFEATNLEGCTELWQKLHGEHPCQDLRATFALGPTCQAMPTMANKEGVAPAYTRTGTNKLF